MQSDNMNTDKVLNAVTEACDELNSLAHKLRSKNDRAALLAQRAIETARQWLIECANEDEAQDPFLLGTQLRAGYAHKCSDQTEQARLTPAEDETAV